MSPRISTTSTIGFKKTEENLEDVSIEVNVNFRSLVQITSLDLKIFSDTDRVKIHGMSNERNQFSYFSGVSGTRTPSQHFSIFSIRSPTSLPHQKINFVHSTFFVS